MIQRDVNLDFVKGILVVFMAVYHTMNYFSHARPEDYGYIRFVTGSFIFISGYIVSTIYEKKFQENRGKVCKRLVIRGLKLLALFIVMNLVINSLGLTNFKAVHFSLPQYINNLGVILISGNSRLTAFQILVPISYLLILSPLFLIFYQSKRYILSGTVILLLAQIFLDIQSNNLYLLIVGFVGLTAGMYANVEKSFSIKNRVLLLCCFVGVLAVMSYLNRNIITYSIGVIIILKVIYDIAKRLNLKKAIYKPVLLFAQYTLVAYIMQIVFLHGLHIALHKQRWNFGYQTIIIFFATNLFLVGLCLLLNYSRKKFRVIDYSYRFIFS